MGNSADNPAHLADGISGTLVEVVYIGTDTRYIVALASGERVTARVQNASGMNKAGYAAGDVVTLFWAAEDAWLLLV